MVAGGVAVHPLAEIGGIELQDVFLRKTERAGEDEWLERRYEKQAERDIGILTLREAGVFRQGDVGRDQGAEGCQFGQEMLQRLALRLDFGGDVGLEDVKIMAVLQTCL